MILEQRKQNELNAPDFVMRSGASLFIWGGYSW